VKKTVQRRGQELSVSLHFVRPGTLTTEIQSLIAYFEQLLGQTQRSFSLDEARSCIGDYRLASCLIATLSNWYVWRQREWGAVVREMQASPDFLRDFASPGQLRLALYEYVNEQQNGFLTQQNRHATLAAFAARYHLTVPALEYLVLLDSDEEALLIRMTEAPPSPQDVATLYNQWAFEAALCSASEVQFVLDCRAFASGQTSGKTRPVAGIGTVIKRLCFLARRLGVYYELSYEGEAEHMLLSLTLYGPQEVTGAPQQYGLRLARLCRLLLRYQQGQKRSVIQAIVEASATVHFLQRRYLFRMDSHLLRLLPAGEGNDDENQDTIFDSSVEEQFAAAFLDLASRKGVEGWMLEREPEPLLVQGSILIPDFALTRGQKRLYVEILGFWTPAYRERKVQKLLQLRGRDDIVLAIPEEAKEAFQVISTFFPIVYYNGQLTVTDMLQVLRQHYDNFSERILHIQPESVRERVLQAGLIPEQQCYELLHCYSRSELMQAQIHVTDEHICYLPGIGLCAVAWQQQLLAEAVVWLKEHGTVPLSELVIALQQQYSVLQPCEEATIEALLALQPTIHITHDSIFEATVMLQDGEPTPVSMEKPAEPAPRRKKRAASARKKEAPEPQDGLWNFG
jgi:predicted nuclease of restriction endonuclease-like RecB superfamily